MTAISVRLLRDRRASELSEIGIVLGIVVVAAIVALRLLGVNIRTVLQQVAAAITGG